MAFLSEAQLETALLEQLAGLESLALAGKLNSGATNPREGTHE